MEAEPAVMFTLSLSEEVYIRLEIVLGVEKSKIN